jgi:3-hydroxyisobutyrate dehydrogenase-like beta-hydroxyacid dehydrogenase
MVGRVGVRWGGTPDEVAAEAEVLIIIVPGSQELHDVMVIPVAREDQPRPRGD